MFFSPRTVIRYLDHDAIRVHCNRPFSSTDEMNHQIVSRWNSTVGKDDTVFILGDMAWKRHGFWINELIGRKVFVFGNHDKMKQEHYKSFTRYFGDPKNPGIHQTTLDGRYVCMSHYPLHSWNGSFYGAFHFYGHCHGRKREVLEQAVSIPDDPYPVEPEELPPMRVPEYDDSLSCAVDVDVWDYTPVAWEVLKAKLQARIPAWKARQARIQEAHSRMPDYPKQLAAANAKWRKYPDLLVCGVSIDAKTQVEMLTADKPLTGTIVDKINEAHARTANSTLQFGETFDP